ncbi:hypothetical protein P691DRAFT_671210 [Macrolepiota fuliginosa MF-IS2]|uniref:Uncharacterized protein n=1 Tax=Macrolepiota fuliginosa MF-IS2 TaxID=1400762 RepID=A0A9P6C1C0_9AGAR|nr:hypothetical protein P691DRAFT_671210 [Macrolepiota fuliginosa MF-IS2]
MPWPAHIQQDLNGLSDTDNIRNHFYPLYLDILVECFPKDRFRICPLYATSAEPFDGLGGLPHCPEGLDTTISIVVQTRDPPDNLVLFIDILPPTSLQKMWLRKEDDERMRGYMEQLADSTNLPKLYGISAHGTRLCYYNVDLRSDPRSEERLTTDTAPEQWWSSDLREWEGRVKFFTLIQEIRNWVDSPTS